MKFHYLKILPNQITLLRVILIPFLWLTAFLQEHIFFGVLFLIAGLTDCLDGYFARKFKQESSFGTRFDSFADNLINVSLIFWFWLLLPDFVKQHIIPITTALLFFIVATFLGFVKYKKMTSYHLYSAKLTNVALYTFFIHAMFFSPNTFFFYVLVTLIILNQSEEIAMTLTRDEPVSNSKSIFGR